MSISSDSSTGDEQQSARLVAVAQQVLVLLDTYPRPLTVATDAVARAQRYVAGRPIEAERVGEYLNHSDPDLDLSAQYSFVEGDEHAMSALDVVSLALGAAARLAYAAEDKPAPEPVLLATPDVVVQAFTIYDELADQGLVATLSDEEE